MPLLIGFGFLIAAALILAKKLEGAAPQINKTMTVIPTQVQETLDDLFKRQALKTGTDWKLLKAIAMTESSLNPRASNPNDPSYGLMGIMPILAEDYGIVLDWHNVTSAEIAMIYDPETNVSIGARYIGRLLKKYPFDSAVQMYNVGEAGFNNGRRNSEYLSKVKTHLAEVS